MNFNWRSILRDLNGVLLTLLLVPIVLIFWLQIAGCWHAKGIAVFAFPMPACIVDKSALSLVAPKAKGAR